MFRACRIRMFSIQTKTNVLAASFAGVMEVQLRQGRRHILFLLFCAACAVTLCFALLISFVYHPGESELRALLTPPDGCAAPCFMGVRLGNTVSTQTVPILRRHPWVDQIYMHLDGYYWDWSWSGDQPAFIDASRRGFLGARAVFDDTYNTLYIATSITLADLVLALGKPDYSTFTRVERVRSRVLLHSVVYEDLGLQADGYIDCPIRVSRLWDIPLVLNWHSDIPSPPSSVEQTYIFPRYPRTYLNSLPLC